MALYISRIESVNFNINQKYHFVIFENNDKIECFQSMGKNLVVKKKKLYNDYVVALECT